MHRRRYAEPGPRERPPIVIAHRGASGHRPEHTLAAYWLAIRDGADFIEPDLVSTRDGVLVARHENEISATTDVAARAEFAARRTTKTIDGRSISGFFTEDFSLAELKTLRVRERLPELRPSNAAFDGYFSVPTLDEVIALAQRAAQVSKREIGIYPETKHPSYFASIGLGLEEPLVRSLHRHGYRGSHAPVFIQSFEVANLQRLRTLTQLPLIQLIDASGQAYDLSAANDPRSYADMLRPEGLAQIARYARGIGVHKALIAAPDDQGRLRAASTLIADAHAAALLVHAWTFRRENNFLATDFQRGDPQRPGFAALIGDLAGECQHFFELGLDGLFSDNPRLAVAARNRLRAHKLRP